MTRFSFIFALFRFIDLTTCMKISEDGRYTQITIKISKDIPDNSCEVVLANLKDLLGLTSSAVGEALSWHAWPAQYIVVVPTHWQEDKCKANFVEAKGDTRFKSADMLVQPYPAHGVSTPLTQQSRGCGTHGDTIVIPNQFITHWNATLDKYGDPGKLLAHQFVKLRFGIFDERGYPSDPLYPVYYKANSRIYPTGVSNTQVKGTWLTPEGNSPCRPDIDNCIYQPQGSNDQVICSLGYLPTLPSVRSYCQPEQIELPTAPTKHNVLCNGRPVLEVIENSDDYLVIKSRVTKLDKNGIVPQVQIVQEKTPKYVLLFETSASMTDNNDWKFINKAAQKLIRYDLQDDARLAVVTFSNTSKVEALLTNLRGSRAHLADIIPDKFRLNNDEGRCVLCGFNTAMTKVLKNDKEGAHVILVTRGGKDSLSTKDEKVILEYAEYYQIVISIIIVPSENGDFLPIYDEMALLSGGRSYAIKDASVIKRYRELSNALSDLVNDANKREVIHENIVEISSANSQTEGEFFIDVSLGEDTQFGIFVEDEEDHLIKSVRFMDSKGTIFGPYSRVATTFDNINMKTLNFGLKGTPPFGDRLHYGRWTYRVEWYTLPRYKAREAAVVITSRQRPEDTVPGYSIKMWTSSETSKDLVTSHHPLAVYVSLHRGGTPVLRAAVNVHTSVFTENGTVHADPIELFDNGNGDPDITGDDGVYSRYITRYPAPGRYAFTVHVSDNNNQAVVAKEDDYPRNNDCCGSNTNVNVNQAEKTGSFFRVARGVVINLVQVPDSTHLDRMPPSKVGDLQVTVIPESHMLRATWTAPGDDFDTGSVTLYKIVYARNISHLLDHWTEKKVLTQFKSQDIAGVKTSFQFQFKHFNQEFYIGIMGVDDANNSGKVSNLVNIVMPDTIHEYTVPIVIDDHEIEVSENEPDNESMMILALCGSFCLLALCLMCGVVYFLKCAKPKLPITVDIGGNDDLTDNGSTCSDPRNTSSHRLMVDVTTVSGTLPTFTAPPDYLPESTPTYWSASQLLTEHEHRALTSTYGNCSLTPIKEEYLEHFDEFPLSDDYHEIPDRGVTNLAYKPNSGTPIHTVIEGRHSSASSVVDTPSDSIVSVGSNLYRVMGGQGWDLEEEQESPVTPVRFSTAVQTIAPSAIATLRQSSDYMASIRSRNASLV